MAMFIFKFSIVLVTFLSFIYGCSSSQVGREKVPVWVGSPYDFCKSAEEICGVGSGSNLKAADLSAKNEIASFFRIQLSSNLVSTLSSNQKEENNLLDAQQREIFQLVISGQVDELVEGVEITQRFILNDKEYYALAKLKKSLLEDNLRQKINILNQKREDLLEKKARLSFHQLQKLHIERLGIEKLLSMLDRPLLGQQKSTNWWQESKSMMQTAKTIKLQLDKNSDEEWQSQLSSVITQSGHKVTQDSNAKYLVKSSFILKMEPINVEGFLKARIEWRASSFDQERGSEVLGAIDESIDVTARNKDQLWHKAKDHFKAKILEKIHLLNI